MIPSYSPQEILKIVVKVEEAGGRLYAKLEYEAQDEQIKKVWGYLREQEHIHKEVFQKMLDQESDYIVDNYNPGEYESYLKAIASEYVFTPDILDIKTREGFTHDLAAIKFGIEIEKDSILTYEAMKEFVVIDRQKTLDNIIAEEKIHLATLIALKASLKKERGV